MGAEEKTPKLLDYDDEGNKLVTDVTGDNATKPARARKKHPGRTS